MLEVLDMASPILLKPVVLKMLFWGKFSQYKEDQGKLLLTNHLTWRLVKYRSSYRRRSLRETLREILVCAQKSGPQH